jgi:hypothetical protein
MLTCYFKCWHITLHADMLLYMLTCYFTFWHKHIYHNISRGSSQNDQFFYTNSCNKHKNNLTSTVFFRKSCCLWHNCIVAFPLQRWLLELSVLRYSVHGEWIPNIMKTRLFILPRKSVSNKQNTKNEEDNIIRKKYIINNKKTVIWGFYRLSVEEPCSGLLHRVDGKTVLSC